MDVICCGMYRACSTWQYEVVGHLLTSRGAGERLGYVEGADYDPNGGRGRARVLKCHDRHPRFDRAIRRGEAVAVYADRDLRDVVDSMRHKTGRTFEALLAEGLVHRILANDRFWTTRPGTIIQRYETLVADPEAGVAELAEGLGIALDAGEAAAIAESYSPEANRRRAEAVRTRLDGMGLDPDDPVAVHRHAPETLLHGNHLRTGRSGGWRAALDADQQALLSRIGGRWLIDRGYERDGSWAPPAQSTALGALRGRWHALVYFSARRHPRVAAPLEAGPRPPTFRRGLPALDGPGPLRNEADPSRPESRRSGQSWRLGLEISGLGRQSVNGDRDEAPQSSMVCLASQRRPIRLEHRSERFKCPGRASPGRRVRIEVVPVRPRLRPLGSSSHCGTKRVARQPVLGTIPPDAGACSTRSRRLPVGPRRIGGRLPLIVSRDRLPIRSGDGRRPPFVSAATGGFSTPKAAPPLVSIEVGPERYSIRSRCHPFNCPDGTGGPRPLRRCGDDRNRRIADPSPGRGTPLVPRSHPSPSERSSRPPASGRPDADRRPIRIGPRILGRLGDTAP